jgi:hypothetical protein
VRPAIGAEVQPEKERVAEVVETGTGCGVVKVDQRDGDAGAEDGIARRKVARGRPPRAFA